MYSLGARREDLKDKVNVSPDQYSPKYGYGKEKKPSYSYAYIL